MSKPCDLMLSTYDVAVKLGPPGILVYKKEMKTKTLHDYMMIDGFLQHLKNLFQKDTGKRY